MSRLNITNATKAQVIATVNAVLALVVSFGLDLSADQMGAILAVVNALAALWVGLTYRQSPKRISDESSGRDELMERLIDRESEALACSFLKRDIAQTSDGRGTILVTL